MLQRLEDLAVKETKALKKGLERERADIRSKYVSNPLAHIARLSEGDPTPFKRLTKAIVRWHGKGELLLEDLYKVHDDLEVFERIRPTLPVEQRDLMRFKSPRDVYELVKPYIEQEQAVPLSQNEKSRIHARKMRQKSDILYEGSEGLIVAPKTKEASSFWGRKTRWCTAAKKDSAFDEYNRDAVLTIVLPKSGGKFQYHPTTSSIMDAQDKPVTLDALFYSAPFIENCEQAMINLWACRPLEMVKRYNFTLEIQRKAVSVNGLILEHLIQSHLKYPSLELAQLAVDQNGDALRFLKQQTPDICLRAVQNKGVALQYVLDPTPEVLIAAVMNDGMAISFIENPSEELCQLAIRNNPEAISRIEKPSYDLCIEAITAAPKVLEFIENDRVVFEAVQLSPHNLEFVEAHNQDLQMCENAIRTAPEVIKFVRDQTPYLIALSFFVWKTSQVSSSKPCPITSKIIRNELMATDRAEITAFKYLFKQIEDTDGSAAETDHIFERCCDLKIAFRNKTTSSEKKTVMKLGHRLNLTRSR